MRYRYDPLGRRVLRHGKAVGINVKYTYDGLDVILDDSNGSLIKYQNGLGVDNKLKIVANGQAKYFLQDHLGSTVGLTDQSGTVLEQTNYDSFGNLTSNLSTRYQFTGREKDEFTGLMYYRARWFDANLGRFISEDPIGFAGGINQFAYVGNNPTGYTDPLGLYEIDVHYYLTYYLAKKTGCFDDAQAKAIAEGNQGTDEDSNTLPGPMRNSQNSKYHTLNAYSYEGRGSVGLWQDAKKGGLKELGIYLHHLQDTYSHSGYSNSNLGHALVSDTGGLGFDAVDKTAYDVPKAIRMSYKSWVALKEYAKDKCGCEGVNWDNAWFNQIKQFAGIEVSQFPQDHIVTVEGDVPLFGRRESLANPDAIRRKAQILFR